MVLYFQQECGSNTDGAADVAINDDRQETDEQQRPLQQPLSEAHIPTDMSDTTESDAEKTQ